jgi:hypothetical protein
MGRHDTGSKTIYTPLAGETPGQDPGNAYTEPANTTDTALAEAEHRRLIEAIFNHVDTDARPTVARFIARKMWKFFAYDPDVDVSAGTGQQDLTLIDALADAFKGSAPDEYNLKNLLRALLLRDEFYADTTRTITGPVEYVMGAVRMVGGKLKRYAKDAVVPGSNGTLALMGQELLNPPDVFSWRGNLFWVTTQTLLKRYQFAEDLAFGAKGSDLGYDVTKLLDMSQPSTTQAAVVDRLLKILLAQPSAVDTPTKNELIAGFTSSDPIDVTDTAVQDEVRGVINLILMMPHFHVH